MNTGKFLFWLGVVVMVVDFCTNLYTFGRLHDMQVGGVQVSDLNAGPMIVALMSSFFYGGVLMGLGKIIEKLYGNTGERPAE